MNRHALAGTSRGTAKVNCPLHLGARGERRNALPLFLSVQSGPCGKMDRTMEEPLFLFGSSVGMAVLPQGGKLSRALPLRGVEIFFALLCKKNTTLALDSVASDPNYFVYFQKVKKIFSDASEEHAVIQKGEKRLVKNFLQTNELDDVTLILFGDAIKEEMQRREKEKLVEDRFGEITEHEKKKNNKIVTYYMVYDGRRQITANTRAALVEKLYDMVATDDVKNITLGELFKTYYQERRNDKSISDQTSDYDRQNWIRFFKGKDIATAKIADITSFTVLNYYKSIVGRGELTRKAFNKAAGLLNGIFDLAVEKGIVSVNVARNTPTRKLTFRPESDNSDMVYKPEERDTLVKYLKNIPQTRYTLACRLMACLPLRMGELRALTWADYNEREQKLHIHHEIVKEERDGKARCDVDKPFVKGGKDTGVRKIPVSSEAAQVLAELRAINGGCKYILQGQGNAEFSMSENRINTHLKEYCQAAGVTYYSSHKFRFYGATQLYKAGVPLDTVRYYLGHSTLKMTEHYLRLTPEDANEDIIERVFG